LFNTKEETGLYPEHELLIQIMKLKNTLRWMEGET
jgi:myo-inositol-1-phosphate synthase